MRKPILLIIAIASASCNPLTQSKSEPVTITAPESKPSNFETSDSSFLKLKIQGNKFEIEFLKKVFTVDNINALDTFFQTNTAVINKEKVVLIGFDTVQKNRSLTDLLMKYGISKFRIGAEENH